MQTTARLIATIGVSGGSALITSGLYSPRRSSGDGAMLLLDLGRNTRSAYGLVDFSLSFGLGDSCSAHHMHPSCFADIHLRRLSIRILIRGPTSLTACSHGSHTQGAIVTIFGELQPSSTVRMRHCCKQELGRGSLRDTEMLPVLPLYLISIRTRSLSHRTP